MTEITVDIETIPSQLPTVRQEIDADAKSEIAALAAPKSYTKPETIQEWLNNKRAEITAGAEEKYLRCSFDGAANHIICIGVQLDDESPVAFTGPGKDAVAEEKAIITQFFDYLRERVKMHKQPIFIGHNIVGFDLKIIKQRCIVLGVCPPVFFPLNARPWDSNPFDTMAQWDAKNMVSLNKICKALGLPPKNGITGENVYPMWREGKIKEIADYCLSDVAKTRAIYKRMQFLPIAEDAPCQAA